MLKGLLAKLGIGAAPVPTATDPAGLADQERRALFGALADEDHSLVIEETPRGATLADENDIISFVVEDDLSYTLTRTQDGEETDRQTGLSSAQMGDQIAEMLHDHLTGWTPAYHAERRARLGIPE